jgi:2'-5' RNA ligase
MEKYKKYIIVFLLPDWYQEQAKKSADIIAQETDTRPIYEKMIFHISIHRPITGISLEKAKNLVCSVALRTHKSRLRIGGLDYFGEKYIVVPVIATKTAAGIWVGVHDELSKVSEYEHGEFDHDNTLHVTLFEAVNDNFQQAKITAHKFCSSDFADIVINEIGLLGKTETGWEMIEEIPLPDK